MLPLRDGAFQNVQTQETEAAKDGRERKEGRKVGAQITAAPNRSSWIAFDTVHNFNTMLKMKIPN